MLASGRPTVGKVDNQITVLRQFAERQGWEIVHEYIDRESGGKADRIEFRRMFADAAQRRFDLILVRALDRLTREGVAETFEYIKRLTSHGVQFVSFTEEHFRTAGPAGGLMIAVAAWIAKQERVRISERVRAGLSSARVHGTKSGKPVGRPKVIFRRDHVLELRNQGKSWRQIPILVSGQPLRSRFSRLLGGAGTLRRTAKGSLVVTEPETASAPPITVVLNWQAGLKK